MRQHIAFMITCLVLLVFINCADPKFKTKVVAIRPCKLADNVMDSSHPVTVKYGMRRINRDISVIDLEFNITKRIGPFLSSARSYSVRQNSVKDLIAKVEKRPCNSVQAKQVNFLLNLKFDQHCYAIPYNYVIKNLNLNSIAWLMTSMAVTPGLYIYELEHSHPKGIVDCTQIICELVTLK